MVDCEWLLVWEEETGLFFFLCFLYSYGQERVLDEEEEEEE